MLLTRWVSCKPPVSGRSSRRRRRLPPVRLAACWPSTSPGPSVRLHCPARSMRCRPLWPLRGPAGSPPRGGGPRGPARRDPRLRNPPSILPRIRRAGQSSILGLLLARDEIVNVADFLNLHWKEQSWYLFRPANPVCSEPISHRKRSAYPPACFRRARPGHGHAVVRRGRQYLDDRGEVLRLLDHPM